MSSKVTGGLLWPSFKFNLFIILMKNMFIVKSSCFLSETSSPFEVNGLIVFKKFLLPDKSFTFRFSKKSFLVFRSSVTEKVVFYNLPNLHQCFFVINVNFNFDLWIIAFFKALDMKGLLLNLRNFFLMGACLWRTLIKIFWKSEKLTVILLLRFLFKSSLKRSTSNEL